MVYEKYIIDNMGTVSYQGRSATDGMDLKNNPTYWSCIKTDKDNKSIFSQLFPNYYKILNEMIFRAFFGSVDGVEFKQKNLETKMDFEWIPYEYDIKSSCDEIGFTNFS